MRIERLAENHPRAGFVSGNEVIDTWFREHAYVAHRQDTARTFVLIDDEEQIVGYYSLTMGGVESTDASRRLTRGLPRFPVPIVLLARLAIDQRFQGQGLGMGFLFEALHRAAVAAEHVAARLIAVDPIDDRARAFYLRWGFRPVDADSGGRLFLRTRDALASFPIDYGGPTL